MSIYCIAIHVVETPVSMQKKNLSCPGRQKRFLSWQRARDLAALSLRSGLPVCASPFGRLDPLPARQSAGLSSLRSRPFGFESRASLLQERKRPSTLVDGLSLYWQRARDSTPRGLRLTAFPMRLLSHSVNPLNRYQCLTLKLIYHIRRCFASAFYLTDNVFCGNFF